MKLFFMIISLKFLSPGDKLLGRLVKKNLWTFTGQIGDDTFSEAMLMQEMSSFCRGQQSHARGFVIIWDNSQGLVKYRRIPNFARKTGLFADFGTA
ncbi:hypothetical protein [Serratia fonticola]|uniref:Uncharacterized protein n=1 Tax=Serratia fonticola TaxID=47917 RepID=A0A448SL31_SERFO|nr:hypothetical protein [Serratia fonticola]CAI1800713.1 Uncharacterised protein [Serratia fonticola]VEI68341.1 Uncharacterised protein [Serratia fonticola]